MAGYQVGPMVPVPGLDFQGLLNASGGGGGGLASLFGAGPSGMVGSGLLALLPMLLGGMFQNDQQAKLREQVRKLMLPQNIYNTGQQLYNQSIQSPAFAQSQRSILGASNQMANSVGSRMAQSLGGGSSAFQQAAVPMARANSGLNMGRLYNDTWNSSMSNAYDMNSRQGQLLAGIGPSPNYGANLFAGGLNSWLPFAFRSMNPNLFAQSPYAR